MVTLAGGPLTVVFILLAYYNFRYYQDALIHNQRYTAPFVPLLETMMVLVLAREFVQSRTWIRKSSRPLVFIAAGIFPLLFNYGRIFHKNLWVRVAPPYTAYAQGLYLPYLSHNDLGGLVKEVEELRDSPFRRGGGDRPCWPKRTIW